MPWDAYAAAEFPRANARPKSIGQCGAYTRQAIEAGGVTLVHHHPAKDYGPSLTAVGFLGLPQSRSAIIPSGAGTSWAMWP